MRLPPSVFKDPTSAEKTRSVLLHYRVLTALARIYDETVKEGLVDSGIANNKSRMRSTSKVREHFDG